MESKAISFCPFCVDWEQEPIELDEGVCPVCGYNKNEIEED